MSDHFLCGCVVLSSGISIAVSDSSSVMSCLIVIAFRVEPEQPHTLADPVIIFFEIFTMLDIFEIWS